MRKYGELMRTLEITFIRCCYLGCGPRTTITPDAAAERDFPDLWERIAHDAQKIGPGSIQFVKRRLTNPFPRWLRHGCDAGKPRLKSVRRSIFLPPRSVMPSEKRDVS
jgi:hypothetical protein